MLKKAKETFQKHKSEVFWALVATAIWELGRNLITSLPDAGNGIIRIFTDLPYKFAAQPSGETLVIYLGIFLIATSVSLAAKILALSIRAYWRAKNIKKHCDMPEVKKESNSTPTVTEEELDQKIIALQNETKGLVWQSIAKCFITLFLCYVLFISMLMPNVLRTSFAWHIDIIAPYTTEQTIIQLKSDWARMDSKEDYDKISDAVRLIMDENNLGD